MGVGEGSQEAVICQLCREPIWNFLCIDCLSNNVQKWLPASFSQEFSGFHRTIKSHFHTFISDNFEPCIDCRKINETPICPYCYTHEVYHWISPLKPDLAENFRKIFFFYPFEGTEQLKSCTKPIEGMSNKKTGIGACDVCGEFSEILWGLEGNWCCEGCADG